MGYQCQHCKIYFDSPSKLIYHKRHNECKARVCGHCKTDFKTPVRLAKHLDNQKNLVCLHCQKAFCSKALLERHLRTVQEVSDDPLDRDRPIQPPTGYEEDEGFKAVLKENAAAVRDMESISKNHMSYNKKIDSSFTYSDLENIISNIYAFQKSAFKIQIGFGFILYNTVSEEYRYFWNSHNTHLFEKAITISDREDLEKLMVKIVNLDLANNYYLFKPSSSWVMAGLVNVEIDIYNLKDVIIGAPPPDLPDYIKNSKSMYALLQDQGHQKPFNDNYCFWRCLALYQGADIRGLERLTKKLVKEATEKTGKEFKKGVNITHIPTLEVLFSVPINIHSLREDGTADVIYLFRLDGKPMHLNLYKNHFSYIHKFDTYAKRYQCGLCDRVFNKSCNLKAHTKVCCTEQEEVYIGGKFHRDQTIFVRLEEEGFHTPEEDRYYPFISVFDYEAIQVPKDNVLKGRNIHFEHVPASFSLCSNIPGHKEPVHVQSKGDPQALVDRMVKIQMLHQEAASQIMQEKHQVILEALYNRLGGLESELECVNSKDRIIELNAEKKKYKTLYNSLMKYCNQLIILGFNSQKYDIPLIRRYLPSSLDRLDTTPSFVIKKDRAYMVIATNSLKYLDLCNYLAAGTSLDGFYKSYNLDTAKSSFCYQWFDSLEKLNYTGLPPQSCFRSILTNKEIDEETYMKCWRVWHENGMKCFGDFVRHYNNHDVIGLVHGIEKMLAIENKNKLDVFKESVSLAGLTQKYLMKNLSNEDYFVGIGKEHAHIYKQLRQLGIVGGPSIIFHRYHEKDVTIIKGKNFCKKIMGYDASSLYLSCTAKEMPTGKYHLREKKDGYKKQTAYSKQGIQWIEYLIRETGHDIRHAENSPHQEFQVGNYSVDGYCQVTNTVYEFNGCFIHGHECKDYNAKKWQATLDREDELRAKGFNVVSITSCEWEKNPASKIWYHYDEAICTKQDIQDAVMNGESFGIIRCSLRVPDELIDHFSEFPPLFKTCEIPMDAIGEHMQEYCRSITRTTCVKRSLISSMHGKDMVILTPLFIKYIQMGLVCDDIEWIMEYTPKSVFKWFQDEVVHDRRMADLDPNWKIRGETSKTKGNCAYGGTIMNKAKHGRVTFTTEKNLSNHINNPRFKALEELNGGIYEVEKGKKKVVLDTPIQIGVAVYSYAKLSLIEFWEFINKFLVNDLYQIMECDTDSLYLALARENIDQCVKPGMEDEWARVKWEFLSSEDTTLMEFEGHTITRKQFDKRTPGKYKPEFVGDGMVCLNSKVYHCWGPILKTSCKGTQQKRNELLRKDFLDLLEFRKPKFVENAGFVRNDDKILTYTQTKKGLEYFYAKRKVLSDGVSTTHLDI